MAAETALRVSSSSSTVCNLNGFQRRPTPLSSSIRFLGLRPRASSSSSISSSLSQFMGSVRIGSRVPISRQQKGKRRNFSIFAMAADGKRFPFLRFLALFFYLFSGYCFKLFS